MSGRGPRPKDPSQRARRNADEISRTVLPFVRGAQPELPGGEDRWPQRTRDWWRMWGESAQAVHWTATDWEFMLETALIHAKFWSGEVGMAGELRLRVGKFGATPEDRARLRIEFTAGPPPGGEQKPPDLPTEWGDLRVIPGGAEDALAGG